MLRKGNVNLFKKVFKSVCAALIMAISVYFCFFLLDKLFYYIFPHAAFDETEFFIIFGFSFLATFFIFLGKNLDTIFWDITRILLLIIMIGVGLWGAIYFFDSNLFPAKQIAIIILSFGLMKFY